MLSNLETYEQIALGFAPVVLVIGGIFLVIIGLSVWLGGLRWSQFIAGFAGAAAGALLALKFTSGEMMAVGLMAVLGAGFATFFRKITLVLQTTVLVAFFTMMFFASSRIDRTQWDWPAGGSYGTDQLNVEQTVSVMGRQVTYICTKISQAFGDLKAATIAVCAALALIVAAAGFFMPRFIGAAGCSALGTSIIYLGMILLLLYKTARPLTTIYNGGAFYTLIFLVMLAFGTMVEMVLCPAGKKKKSKKDGEEGDQ